MCFRMQSTRPKEIEARIRRWVTRSLFDDALLLKLETEVQAQAFPVLPVVFESCIHPMTWGLRPDWSERAGKSKEGRLATLNCRSEEMFEKVSFKKLASKNRCIIPIEHFVEWRHEEDGTKTRYNVKLAGDEPVYLGGICQLFENEYYFTVCTIVANELMTHVHNTKKRMPLIIREKDFERWMTADQGEGVTTLLQPDNSLPLVAEAQQKPETEQKQKKLEAPEQADLF